MNLDISIVAPALKPFSNLEQLIYEGTKESIQEAATTICPILGETYLTYFYYLIDHASKIRRRNFINLSTFFNNFTSKKPINKLHPSLFFSYLVKKGIIDESFIDSYDNQDNKSETDIEYVFPDKSIEYYIMTDDLNHFLNDLEQNKKKTNDYQSYLSKNVILDDNKYNFLSLAAYFGSEKIFKFLFNECKKLIEEDLPNYAVKGGNLNIIGICEQNNLDFSKSLNHAIFYYRLNVCKWLLECYGLKNHPDAVAISVSSFNTILVSYFVRNFTGVNEFGPDGLSPLMFVSKIGNLEYLKYIIKHNAWINMKDMYKRGAIHIAIQENQFDIVKYLISNDASINALDNCNISPLMYAVIGKSVQIARYLILKGANVNEQDLTGMTSLLYACENGDVEMVKLLINKGADTNLNDIFCHQPIHLGARSGNIELIQFLLSIGQTLDAKDQEGKTPIFYAVQQNNIEAVKYIISHSISTYQVDNQGKELISYATSPEMIDLLQNQPKVVTSTCRI